MWFRRIASKYPALGRGARFWWNGLVHQYDRTLVEFKLFTLKILTPTGRSAMSYQAIREYLMAVQPRYQLADRREKGKILDEVSKVTHLTRKHSIRMLNEPARVPARKKASGRYPKYDRELLLPHIEYLWIQMERISARRMKAAFPDWFPHYQSQAFTTQVRLQLEAMSVSTLERFLRLIRKSQSAKKGLSSTCPARYMKNQIPLNTFDAKIDRPGYLQADTVAHCGTSLEGQFVNSITLTDIDSTWTENRAMFSKKATEVKNQFIDLEESLPFDLRAINTDSGSEFLNKPVLKFMRPSEAGRRQIAFTRSRPYRKNDNCYVEQKNFTHVRELFGYERIEDPELVGLMNEIYKNYWNPLQNFFLPTFKLKEKVRIGARIVKKFDRPETPYDRLLRSAHLSEEQKAKLRKTKLSLNPFQLKADLRARIGEDLRHRQTRILSRDTLGITDLGAHLDGKEA
jgi:hypothetical protein